VAAIVDRNGSDPVARAVFATAVGTFVVAWQL
jgi:hypothetical protein